MELRFKTFHPQAKQPVYGSQGAAGADLCAVCGEEGVLLKAGQRVLIPTGIGVEIPQGYVGLVFARSSMGVKYGISLSNAVGVIDSDYRGEISVGLINLSDTDHTILPGERIAQLVIMPVAAPTFVQVDELSETKRGAGGFGSTGRVELAKQEG